MRVTSFVVALLFLFPIPTFAQSWFEYVNQDEQVSVNFTGPPEISDHSYLSPTGWSLPAKRFEAMEGESRYSVTVVNFGGSPQEDYSAAIQHAADQYRDVSGTVTYDDRGGVDGHEGQMVQLTNEDGSRTFVQIAMYEDRLYIVDATVPPGSIVPGHFQQSLVMLDEQGRRVRFQRNEAGERYRAIPGSGGEPFVE